MRAINDSDDSDTSGVFLKKKRRIVMLNNDDFDVQTNRAKLCITQKNTKTRNVYLKIT